MTDWLVILDESDSLEQQTIVLTDYINNCVDQFIPSKTSIQYPNGEPWINKELTSIIKSRRHAIASGQSRGMLCRQINLQ